MGTLRSVRGLTMVEAIVVVAIILLVSAIATPIVNSVRHRSHVTASNSNMRQLFLSLQMYRQDHDGNDASFEFYTLGLPPDRYFIRTWFPKELELWRSPCGLNSNLFSLPPMQWLPGHITYSAKYYEPALGIEPVANYLRTYRENSVVFLDPNCNDFPASKGDLIDPYREKRIVAVLLSGQVINKVKKGDAIDIRFYSDPPAN